jgi:predicted nucleic acid-binding protein
MKKTVYVETSVFSLYHDERPESLYRREITRSWWREERRSYSLYTSHFCLEEVSNPVYPAWKRVSALARKLPLLEMTEDIPGIVRAYIANRLMPADDAGDAAHLAIASYHEVDYLLTWNCRHLANANKFDHIRTINRRLGMMTPELVTPEQLFREDRQ